MGYLSRNDVTSVMDCVRDLYLNPAYPDFPAHAVAALHKLMPSMYAVSFTYDVKARSGGIACHPINPYPEDFLEGYAKLSHQCPFHYLKFLRLGLPADPDIKMPSAPRGFLHALGAGKAVMLSDAQNRRQFHKLELYNELLTQVDLEFWLAVRYHQDDYSENAMVIARDSMDFSERERQMLDLLGPHLRQSFELHRAFTAPQKEGSMPSLHRYRLTERESEVLHWVAMGKANGDIAEILDVALPTVKKHLERIFQKLGVENRTAAALMAVEAGNGR